MSNPGDPDYLSEYSGEQLSIRDAVEGYCAVNRQLSWVVEDDVLNVRSVDLKKRTKNPLDIIVDKIKFGQGSSLWGCLASLAEAQPRIAAYMDAFAENGRRITENLDFEG